MAFANSYRKDEKDNLAPDGDLGGANSNTRKKLNLPLSQLTAP